MGDAGRGGKDSADTIRKATLGEIRAAVDVCKAESEASLAFFRGWLGED